MSILIKKDKQWSTVNNVFIYQNNHWQPIKQVYIKHNQEWQSIWQNIIIFINDKPQTSINLFEYMGCPNKAGNFLFINNAEINAIYGEAALSTGIFPKKSKLTIINNSFIRGHGGNGGASYSEGQPGGDAIFIEYTCTLTNNGYLYAGGGGGGGFYAATSAHFYKAGGGGGAGFPYGSAGELYSGANGGAYFSGSPLPGNQTIGGKGGYGGVNSGGLYIRYDAGSGGSLGLNGEPSIRSKGSAKDVERLYAGGAAGLAVNKNNHEVILINTHDENIKGDVK